MRIVTKTMIRGIEVGSKVATLGSKRLGFEEKRERCIGSLVRRFVFILRCIVGIFGGCGGPSI